MADDTGTVQARPYEFEALQPREIRLLHVTKISSVLLAYRRKRLRGIRKRHPKRDGKASRRYWSNVEFDLTTVSLDSFSDKYVAMSYAWGYQYKRRGIFNKNGTALDISETLERLLQYVLAHRREQWFWIDAICIDQASKIERSSQVAMMRDIYSNAAFVCVWLPNISPLSDLPGPAKYNVAIINEYLDLFQSASSGVESARVEIEARRLSVGKNSPSSTLGDIFDESWFTRIWPIQELVVAKSVLVALADQHIEWDGLVAFARGLEKHDLWALLRPRMTWSRYYTTSPGRLPLGLMNLLFLADMRDKFRGTAELQLSETLLNTIRFAASEPLDRIFALLGICPMAKLLPDYTRDVQDVYHDSTLRLIEMEQSLRILTIAGVGHDEQQDHQWRSWVPRYNRWLQYTPILQMYKDDFDCSTIREQNCVYCVKNSSLVTTGKIIDQVQTLSFPVGVRSEDPLRWFRNMCRLVAWTKYPSGQDWAKVISEIVMGGSSKADRFRGSHSVKDFESALGFTVSYPGYGLTHYPDVTKNLQNFESTAKGRRCFSTRSGYLGLSGAFIKEGDEVAYLSGFEVPVLLRRKEVEDAYELVADCYISGLLLREAASKGEIQQIIIR